MQWLDIYYACFRKDLRSVLFGQIQIGNIQRILCPITASHHAATAADASGSRRAFAAEIWVGEDLIARLSFRGLEDSNLRAIKRISRARILRSFPQ